MKEEEEALNTIHIKKISEDKKSIRQFIQFEFDHYKDDPDWVPMLISDTRNTLMGKNNPLFDNGPHAMFMAYDGQKTAGRILVGIDEVLNQEKGLNQGYFSMFECIENYQVAKELFDAGVAWLKEQGVNSVIGPLSPSNSDDRKGFVVMGEGSPVLLNAYTKPYYPEFADRYGFQKNDDHFAYLLKVSELDASRVERLVNIAKKRYGFHVDRINKNDLANEAVDIKKVLDTSVLEEWDYLTAPSLQGIIDEFNSLKLFYNNRYCFIARSEKDGPVGLVVTLPDYNQVLKKMGGKLFPFGWAKFLYYRNKITGVRGITQNVVPEYHNKGVTHAMYFRIFQDCIEQGMEFIECSCIDETNIPARSCIEGVGGKHYRTYRTYRYNF